MMGGRAGDQSGPALATPHRPQVDGLRFLAFLAVFVHHARPEICPWGWAGVQFFFALSGFLITRILIRGESGEIGSDLRRYYIRRTLRIFPLYYALVLFAAFISRGDDLGWFLTFTYNVRVYLTGDWDMVMGHFWTLCVEEQFYLLYPLALLFTPARRRVALIVGLIAATKGFQIYAHHRMTMPWARLLLPYCGEDLLWGCLAGMIELRTRPGRVEGPACFVAGWPILVLAWTLHERRLPMPSAFQEVGSVSLFGIGSALVVFGAWRSEGRWFVRPLAIAPMAYLGRISYGLYAFHLPVIRGGWLYGVPYAYLIPRPYGALALTIILAVLSWHLYEGPINRMKDRLAGRGA
ncbi:acyltransferase family protein [Tundrisphaera lichenicola]|uniref:acyltransferase family protein n=1 Tax=Tundrisphaera lichenicola TaxID=2029860 RepID=UPI003EB94A69